MFRHQRPRRAVLGSVLGFVLRRAKIYLRDSPAFINGNGDGARAHGALQTAV